VDIAGGNEVTQGQPNDVVHVQTVVVGGGQAGLAVGHSLGRRGLPFVILDAHTRIGDAWRTRWDSLRLFSAARYDALPGMPFPGRADSFPTKDEMADYLEAYAARFEFPVRTGVRVDRLRRRGDRFELTAGTMRFAADNVVVAMGSHQVPSVPPFAGELDPGIVQLHAAEYRNPSQLREGNVLVVGVGNSGGEIAVEVAARHATSLAGKEVGVVPFRIDSLIARRVVLPLLFRFIAHHLLTVDTPLGRRMRPKLLSHGQPLVRVKPSDLAAAGVERVGRVVGVQSGLPVLEDGRTLEVANVIWCRDTARRLGGSTSPCSTRQDMSRGTTAGSSTPSPASTSSACSSSTRCRPGSCGGSEGTPSTSSKPSRLAPGSPCAGIATRRPHGDRSPRRRASSPGTPRPGHRSRRRAD
jgi:putative flavoprotein involved in K+ transport